MAYCGPAGIPYLEFVGRWDELSRDAALAWQVERDSACAQCGQHRDDWVTIGPDGTEREIRPAPFQVVDHHCPSCEALDRARKNREKEERPGMHLAFAPAHRDEDDAPPSGLWLPGDP